MHPSPPHPARASSRAPLRAAPSVPTTLVWTNAAGPSIERSTWLSAAKLTIASGWCVASSEATSARSPMSPCTNTWPVVAVQRRERVAVAGIGQRIEIDDADAAIDCVEHEVASDETGAAGDQPCLHCCFQGVLFGADRVVRNDVACMGRFRTGCRRPRSRPSAPGAMPAHRGAARSRCVAVARRAGRCPCVVRRGLRHRRRASACPRR